MGIKWGATEQALYTFFKGKGLNDNGIYGLLGNLYAESALNPKNLQNSYEKKLGFTDESYTAAVDNGTYKNFVKDAAGYGLAQWTYYTRKQGLLDYVKAKGASIGSMEAQQEFLYKELSGSYKGVLSVLKTATSIRQASDAVLLNFERPADQSAAVQKKRAGYGEEYAAQHKKQTGGNTVMGIRIGHASISENGTTSGKPGDQTGKEVCIREWYNKPWDYVAIHPDAKVREKHAAAVEAACRNDNIGYNWYGSFDRNSLNKLAKEKGYDLSKVGLCNCDCSSLQNVAAVASGSGATYGSNGWTTGTMKAALQKLGYKIITDPAYLKSSAYCVRGAIYVKASAHTVCGLDNGANAAKTLAAAGISSGTGGGGKKDEGSGSGSGSGSGAGTATKAEAAQHKDASLAGAYQTTADLNMRTGAGTGKKILTTIPKGKTVRNYGYYNVDKSTGKKWLYVTYGNYTGYCSSSYLKKK